MPDDKLAKPVEARQTLEKRLDPQVLSNATPEIEFLLQARADVTSDELIQALFREELDDEQLVNQLTARLITRWRGHEEQAREAAQYLVDEHRQLGEGIHLVSSETGKVVVTLTEDDIWQPDLVPREGGGMAQPLKQIRPDLAAYVTTWTFDRSREAQIVAKLAARGHQTALLREEGDPRLLVATRAGRRHIVESLARFRPDELLRALGGTSAAFLNHFELTTEDAEGEPSFRGTVNSRSVMNIQDQTTVNLHHNRPATLQGALTQGWVREVARRLITHAAGAPRLTSVEPRRLTRDLLQCADFWIAPPEVLVWVRRVNPGVVVLPVDRITHMVGLVQARAGTLKVPAEFGLNSREMFDRWETTTELEFALWLDSSAITVIGLTGIEYQGVLDP